ncbi:MAG: DUF4358 domain-containing protein [Clostridia bacterium]|nr:DUF4358 domain-containing protein [Clostridia bacterium]
MRRIYATAVAFLLVFCIIFSLCACSGTNTEYSPDYITSKLCEIDKEVSYIKLVPEQIPSFFNISVSDLKNYSVFIADNENSSNTIAVFEINSKDDKTKVLEAINTYINGLSKTFELSNINEFKKLSSRVVLELGDCIVLVVSDNVPPMLDELDDMGAKALK